MRGEDEPALLPPDGSVDDADDDPMRDELGQVAPDRPLRVPALLEDAPDAGVAVGLPAEEFIQHHPEYRPVPLVEPRIMQQTLLEPRAIPAFQPVEVDGLRGAIFTHRPPPLRPGRRRVRAWRKRRVVRSGIGRRLTTRLKSCRG